MKNTSLLKVVALGFLCISLSTKAQITQNTFGKGIKLKAEDGSFEMKFSIRFQTLYVGKLNLETDDYSDQLLIRRARLKFDGFAFSPKLNYKIELGITNSDTRNSSSIGIPQNGGTANIILDAVLRYEFADNWEVWFGQTKLPGNRERVISSQKLQFVDRSLVNSRFNIDRDTGLQLHHKSVIGSMVLNQALAISIGEGRDITSSNNPGGYDYTGRLELLPFGEFTNKGDYFGADLEREETPKLSVGFTADFNDNALRQGGQLGRFVTDGGNQLKSDLTAFFLDAVLKYNGLSVSSEFASKAGSAVNGFGTGSGFVAQVGYVFKNNIEPAIRFTKIEPDNFRSRLSEETEYTFGLSKYIVDHSLKVQTDFSYTDFPDSHNEFRYRFQVEFSF
ncbi:MAG: porin [Bacteroidetes bacterium]|nr:porin [Bacteroidota bacterium]MDA1119724.1 porin [Bacteroidota bacterium]